MDNFKKVVVSTIGVLLLSIVILSFWVNSIGLKLKNVEVVGGTENAQVYDQEIKFKFNMPISKEKSNIQAKYYIGEKETKLTSNVYIAGERVYLFFDQNLAYDSEYTIRLEGIKDIYGEKIDDTSIKLKTQPAAFYYLYQTDVEDILMKKFLNGSPIEIFKSVNIQNYTYNSNFIVVAVEFEEYSDLIVIDRHSYEVVSEHRFDFQQIGKLDITNEGNRILFTLQEYEFDGDFVIPTSTNQLYYYDIDSSILEKFEYTDVEFDINEIVISPDGNFVLLEDSTEGFYLIDLNDINSGITLGKYISTGGFNSKADKILFLSFEPENYERSIFITYYDLKDGLKELTHGGYEVIDPMFFHNSDRVVYSKKKDSVESRGVYQVVKSDMKGVEDDIYDISGFSLEYPKISLDDRYIVMEKYDYESIVEYNYSRASGYLTKPNKAILVVYDLQENKVIDEVDGIEANWVL